MMLQRLRKFICSAPQNTVGNSQTSLIVTEDIQESPCYVTARHEHRWQGDIYRQQDFEQVPTPQVPFWMLLNRTCHLVEDKVANRTVKLPYLVFCTVLPLTTFIKASDNKATLKNQVSNLVNNKDEGLAFLPACPENGVDEPLVVDFNMIYSFRLAGCPTADKKVLQLSSPFAEHLVQRFSRWFYTVGYDDSKIKSREYIETLVNHLEQSH